MNIAIGNTIRALRLKRGVTQEQLAARLGVTPQAVSRWESGIGYPDIELLPPLADFFSVTSDELLGIDRPERERRLAELRAEIKRLELSSGDGRDAERLDFARRAAEEFPSERDFQINLANCICRAYMWEENPDTDRLSEAERIYLSALRDCDDIDVRCRTTGALCCLYSNGFRDESKALLTAEKLPAMAYSREFARATALSGENTAFYTQQYIEKLTDSLGDALIHLVVSPNVPNDPGTWDKKLALTDMALGLYKLVACGSPAKFSAPISYVFRIRATYLLAQGRNEEALDALESMCEYISIYDGLPEGSRYTSPALDLIAAPCAPSLFPDGNEHSIAWTALHEKLPQTRYDPIRADARFVAVAEALESIAI